MKGLIMYILQKNNVDAISYFNIMGQGSLERAPSEKIIQGYRTEETFVPEFARRTRVEIIVPDPKVKEITDAIKQDGTIKGDIFIFDISESIKL